MSDSNTATCCGISVKWLSLCLVIVHSVTLTLLIRLSRTTTSQAHQYLSTTAIFFMEVLKFIVSFVLQAHLSGSVAQFWADISEHFIGRPLEFLQAAVPAVLYIVQNNMIYIALSNLAASTFEVTYQTRIITTAFMSVLMLNVRLGVEKWAAVFCLAVGVVLVGTSQPNAAAQHAAGNGNNIVGLMAVLCASCTSAFNSTYMEKMLKHTTASIWIRNIQLSVFGMIVGLVVAFRVDGDAISQDGFMQGYTALTWVVIFVQGLGGILVAITLKYADSILKCISSSVGIVVMCCISSVILHEADLNFHMLLGTGVVLMSSTTYALGVRRFFGNEETIPLIKTGTPPQKGGLQRENA